MFKNKNSEVLISLRGKEGKYVHYVVYDINGNTVFSGKYDYNGDNREPLIPRKAG